MSDNITNWTRRTKQYWYVDGLSEIGSGAVILSVGLLFGAASLFPDEHVYSLLQGIGIPVIVIGLTILMRWVVSRLKRSVTYPRTGYIAYRPPEPRRRISRFLSAVLVSSAIGLVVALTGHWINPVWIPAVIGLFFGLVTLFIAYRIRLFRFILLAVIPMIAGLLLSFLRIGDPLHNAWLFGTLGLSWILSGSITLARYLHSTSPVELSRDDGENG